MPALTVFVLSPEEEQALHRRLAAGDNMAFADLAMRYLDPLIRWLRTNNLATVPEEMCITAAEDALLALVKSPLSFKPSRKVRLEAYLRMSAQGDLKNALQREKRHRHGRISIKNVELSGLAGKYSRGDDEPWGDDEPCLALQIQEAVDKAYRDVPESMRDGLTEGEMQFFMLMERGERKTVVLAKAIGADHLPKSEQAVIVKRTKDKLKKRKQRGARPDDHAP